MNGIQSLFGGMNPEKEKEVQRSATAAGKEFTAAFATQTVKDGGKTDITVSVSEGAVGNVEEEICYGDVSKNHSEEKSETIQEEENQINDDEE